VENKLQTLKSKEFEKLFFRGRKKNLSPWLFASFFKEKNLKVGFTLPRKVAKACVRNKLRRWMKEILRKESFSSPLHINFVFSSRNKNFGREFFKNLKYREFEYEFSKGLKKIRNLCM